MNIEPAFFVSAAELGRLMYAQGKLDEAEKIYRGLFALHPREPAFAQTLELIIRARGRTDEADQWHARAVELTP